MTEQEALVKMIAPGTPRKGKYRDGVIQILITSKCDLACMHCTQGSQLSAQGRTDMTVEQFEQACISLKGWWGVVGVFGGNPALNKRFIDICDILRKHFPKEQRGLWCNNPINPQNAAAMRETFDPRVSNLNCHLSNDAYLMFRNWWPESMPFGLDKDSRHSPPFVAMRDVLTKECQECFGMGIVPDNGGEERIYDQDNKTCPECNGIGKVYDEERAWELISNCDINQHWSAGLGVFRGQLRAWFCEVAMSQALLHQDEPDYPDTGFKFRGPAGNPVDAVWWRQSMTFYADQVRKHCHECSVPLRGYGELSQAAVGTEQTSKMHLNVYHPKRKDRPVQVVQELAQLGMGKIQRSTNYLQNAKL